MINVIPEGSDEQLLSAIDHFHKEYYAIRREVGEKAVTQDGHIVTAAPAIAKSTLSQKRKLLVMIACNVGV